LKRSTSECAIARQRRRKGDRVRTEGRLPPAPERHRLRRIAEHERHQALVGQPLRVRAGLAEVVRTVHGRDRDALRARQRGERGERRVDRRIGETEPAVHAQCRAGHLLDARRRMTVDLAGVCLQRIGGHARQAVASLAVGLRGDQRAGSGPRVLSCGAAGEQRAEREFLGLGEAQSDGLGHRGITRSGTAWS